MSFFNVASRVLTRNAPALSRSQMRTMFGRSNLPDLNPSRDILAFVREMERNLNHLYRDFNRSWTIPHALPHSATSEAGNMFRLNVDMAGFKPDDIKVSLNDRLLTIQAKMDQKSEDGSRFYQDISREYFLPEQVQIEGLKSVIGEDGVLRIEAPLPEAEKPREIFIDRHAKPKEIK